MKSQVLSTLQKFCISTLLVATSVLRVEASTITENLSGRLMSTTDVIYSGPHHCYIWNWLSRWIYDCKQVNLPNGQTTTNAFAITFPSCHGPRVNALAWTIEKPVT
jgi:hypothetical protein